MNGPIYTSSAQERRISSVHNPIYFHKSNIIPNDGRFVQIQRMREQVGELYRPPGTDFDVNVSPDVRAEPEALGYVE